jgi:hypothetical protein
MLIILNINRPPCSYFPLFAKNVLIKSCSSSEDLSGYKMSWSYVDCCKFRIHLRSLNVHHFEMVAATSLKTWRLDHLQWHDLPTEFHKKSTNTFKSQLRRQTHRQDGDLISLHFSFRMESRLKAQERRRNTTCFNI